MDKVVALLKNINIFSGVSDENLSAMLLSDGVYETECSKGEKIIQNSHQMIIILSGTAVVINGNAVLRTITSGGVFGIVTLFSEKGAETEIMAKTNCRLLVLPEKAVEFLLKADSAASMNYIRFLTDRIHFLNSVIDRYTAGNIEDNLSAFLLNLSEQYGNTFSLNITAAASQLNIGRASLYRAIDALNNKGAITKNGKEITITDKSLLSGKNILQRGNL